MKNLITAIASIMLIMALLLQVTANQKTYSKLITIDQLVNNFKEVAREEGCVSSSNKKDLKNKINKSTGIKKADITITGTSKKVARGKNINYKVSVVISNIIGAPGFLGIKSSKNKGTYVISQTTTSEYLLE